MNEPTSSVEGNGPTSTDDVKDKASEVGSEVSAQAKTVAREASAHARDLADRARRDVRDQARERSTQAAAGLRTLSSQLGALSDGDPDRAGPLADYLREAGDRVTSLAGRLDGGPDAVLDDLRMFARRRPLVFLGAAGVLGFAAGRLLRAGVAAARDDDDNGQPTAALDAPPVGTRPVGGGPPLGEATPLGAASTGIPSEVIRP